MTDKEILEKIYRFKKVMPNQQGNERIHRHAV